MTRVMVADVLRTVATRYDVSPEELASDAKSRRITQARQIGFWLARRVTGRSLASIAAPFGHRDHKAVYDGIHRVEGRRARDAGLREELAELELILRTDIGRSVPPADRCLEHIEVARLARSILIEHGRVPDRGEAIALSRALLGSLGRAAEVQPAEQPA